MLNYPYFLLYPTGFINILHNRMKKASGNFKTKGADLPQARSFLITKKIIYMKFTVSYFMGCNLMAKPPPGAIFCFSLVL